MKIHAMTTTCTVALSLALVASLFADRANGATIVTTILDADFDSTTLDAGTGGTPVTQALLNEGTAVGSWTVASAGSADFLRNTATPGDTVFKPDQGSPDFSIGTAAPSGLGATTVSFDFALRRFNPGSQDRDPRIVAFDGLGSELFTLTVAATGGADQRKLGFISGGTPTYLGNVDDIARLVVDSDGDLSGLNTITVELGAAGFDIILDGTELAAGVPYETVGATTFGGLQFTGDGPAGYYVDNILAISIIPEPSTGSLAGGLAGLLAISRRRRRRRH